MPSSTQLISYPANYIWFPWVPLFKSPLNQSFSTDSRWTWLPTSSWSALCCWIPSFALRIQCYPDAAVSPPRTGLGWMIPGWWYPHHCTWRVAIIVWNWAGRSCIGLVFWWRKGFWFCGAIPIRGFAAVASSAWIRRRERRSSSLYD